MILEIVDERVPDSAIKNFGSLEPGTVFRFKNDNDPKRVYIKTKNQQTPFGILCTAIPLFDHFEETCFIYDCKVIALEAELHILKESEYDY